MVAKRTYRVYQTEEDYSGHSKHQRVFRRLAAAVIYRAAVDAVNLPRTKRLQRDALVFLFEDQRDPINPETLSFSWWLDHLDMDDKTSAMERIRARVIELREKGEKLTSKEFRGMSPSQFFTRKTIERRPLPGPALRRKIKWKPPPSHPLRRWRRVRVKRAA
jgi:hypothetical protein